MKPTLSQDGELRFTVNIKVRAGQDELRNAVCWKAVNSDGMSEAMDAEDRPAAVAGLLKPLESKSAVIEALREAVQSDGDGFHYWSDHTSHRMADEISGQARALVQRLFPELKPNQVTI